MGLLEIIDLFMSHLTKQDFTAGGREHRCIQPGLVQCKRLRKPSVVIDNSLAQPDKATDGQSSHNHTALDHATMVSNDPGDARVLFMPSPSNSRPGNSAKKSGHLHNETRGSELVAWPISRNPLHHEEFLQRL